MVSCTTPIERTKLPFSEYPVKGKFTRVFSKFLGSDIGSLTEIIPANENEENWTNMISLQYMHGVTVSPKIALQNLSKRAKTQCGDKFKYTILSEKEKSIVFEWRVTNCKQQDYMKHILRGISVNDCNLNYFTGLIWEGSNVMEPSCNVKANQIEIASFILGKEGLHRVAYTEKSNSINKKKYNTWVKRLEETTLWKGDKQIK